MLNTSQLEINSTSELLTFDVCFNSFYVGMIILYVAESLCFVLGTPAHCWLLWVYLHAGWKIKPTQVFPLNINIMELIYCIQCAVQMARVLIFNSSTLWMIICIVFGLSWAGRPLMQVCVCVEQYLAVVYPLMFVKYKGQQYRIVGVAVVWIIAATCAVSETFANHFSQPIFNAIFFISVIIISFCCVSVLHALKQPGPGDTRIPMERGRDVGSQQKRNAFNTIFTGLLMILFTYLPHLSVNVMHEKQLHEKLFYCNFVPIMSIFNVLGMMITPFQKKYKNGNMK